MIEARLYFSLSNGLNQDPTFHLPSLPPLSLIHWNAREGKSSTDFSPPDGKRRGRKSLLQPCQTFLARPFRAVAAVKRRPIFHAPTSGSLARFFGRNSTPREIRRLQLPSPTHTRIVEETRLSIRAKLLPSLDYYCYQDQVSMDQKNSHTLIPCPSYCVNRVRNRFSIEEGWIGRKRKGCEIDRMERKWEAIIGDFYGVFFFYIYRYCRAEDGRINKTEIRELNPVSGSVEILATFQYPRVSSSRNSAGRDPIHFAWPRMLGWTDEPQVHRLLPIVDGLKYLCKTMPVSFPASIMARPPFSPVRSVEPDTNSLFICCWIKFALNFV